jgi:mono/diheme cytochrome c family protein
MRQYSQSGFRAGPRKNAEKNLLQRVRNAITAVSLLTAGAIVGGCGGGGGGDGGAGVSPQVVSGVAATGAPLAGQVSLRDSSPVRRDKATVIANDGSFAIDVSDMTGPFILKATGTADGASRTMFSFADKPGTANINPLSTVAVASAAGIDDPATAFDKPDAVTLEKIRSGMSATVATLQTKLVPLLNAFGAAGTNPVKDSFTADHTGLDGVFDNVKISLAGGILTISNATTGAIIFTAQVKDIAGGRFTDKDDDVPKAGPRPAAPTGLKAVGGDAQVTVSWDPVADATSYELFYSTKANVAAGEDHDDVDAKRVKNVTSPFVQKGLTPATTYFFMVRAINNNRRGPASAEVSATTSGTTPAATAPAAPTGLSATGGTKQATISWTAVTGASAYNLYWSTTTGVSTTTGTKISDVTSPAVQTGLSDSTTYFYIVTAANSAGESVASVQVAATTLPASPPPPVVPAAPTGLSATGGVNQATVSWSSATGASSYNLYWSNTAGVTTATGTRIAGVSSPFVHTGLTAGTAYFYVVTAANSAGESAVSSEATATTNPAVIDGAALYTQYCSGCHGPLATSDKRGASAASISSGIANVGVMNTRFNAISGTQIKLTPDQIAAISAALQ